MKKILLSLAVIVIFCLMYRSAYAIGIIDDMNVFPEEHVGETYTSTCWLDGGAYVHIKDDRTFYVFEVNTLSGTDTNRILLETTGIAFVMNRDFARAYGLTCSDTDIYYKVRITYTVGVYIRSTYSGSETYHLAAISKIEFFNIGGTIIEDKTMTDSESYNFQISPPETVTAVDDEGDGVINDWDSCPGTPYDVPTDSSGCEVMSECVQDYTDDDLYNKFEEGKNYCKNNPEECGLYSKSDLNNKYDKGYNDGVASIDVPECVQDYTDDDLDDKYKEGYQDGQNDCSTCEDCEYTKADIDTKYQEGYDKGCSDCSNGSLTPAYLSSDLKIHIPKLKYNTPFGEMSFWVDMEFAGEDTGDLLWKMLDFGEN
ncbi:MAG: hypothetical protein U9P10_15680 [Thermodesulfobacteriota bacterium]|nr:hypothetical protein [Thermodesulfobacteriota bacterium]